MVILTLKHFLFKGPYEVFNFQKFLRIGTFIHFGNKHLQKGCVVNILS